MPFLKEKNYWLGKIVKPETWFNIAFGNHFYGLFYREQRPGGGRAWSPLPPGTFFGNLSANDLATAYCKDSICFTL